MENPALFRGPTRIYQRAPVYLAGGTNRLQDLDPMSGAPPPGKHVYIPH